MNTKYNQNGPTEELDDQKVMVEPLQLLGICNR